MNGSMNDLKDYRRQVNEKTTNWGYASRICGSRVYGSRVYVIVMSPNAEDFSHIVEVDFMVSLMP